VVISSSAVEVRSSSARPEQWAAGLRAARPPVIGVVRDGALLLDVLALLPGDERRILAAVRGLPDA
jgi:hypothetical protein